MIQIKVCGITNVDDALQAAWSGADLLGFVFAPSPRQVDPATVRDIGDHLEGPFPHVGRVGVFVDPSAEEIARVAREADLTHLQIHGRVPLPLPIDLPWIAARGVAAESDVALPLADPWAVLFETKVEGLAGGTGRTFPWEWLRPLLGRARVFVAGGLDAERVASLLATIAPFGVDASSRLERAPGVKDPAKVRAYVDAVRAHERLGGGGGA
jgi:phosphoribosylanthranilate isomerase